MLVPDGTEPVSPVMN